MFDFYRWHCRLMVVHHCSSWWNHDADWCSMIFVLCLWNRLKPDYRKKTKVVVFVMFHTEVFTDGLPRYCWSLKGPTKGFAFQDVLNISLLFCFICWLVVQWFLKHIVSLFFLVHLFRHGYIDIYPCVNIYIYIYYCLCNVICLIYLDMSFCSILSALCPTFRTLFLRCSWVGVTQLLAWMALGQGYAYLNYINCDEASFSRLDQPLDLFRSLLKQFVQGSEKKNRRKNLNSNLPLCCGSPHNCLSGFIILVVTMWFFSQGFA